MTTDPEDADTLAAELRAHFQAVGRVTITSSWLEDVVRSVYIAMLDSPVAAPYVAAGQTFGTMHAACLVIQHETHWQHDPAPFDRLMQAAKTRYEQRNEIVHGTWISVADEAGMTASRSRRWSIGAPAHGWTVEAMHRLADEMLSIGEELKEMIKTGHYHPRP